MVDQGHPRQTGGRSGIAARTAAMCFMNTGDEEPAARQFLAGEENETLQENSEAIGNALDQDAKRRRK